MIKKINLLLFIVLISLSNLSAAESLEIESEITDVIVYPEWAFVTRVADIQLEKGSKTIVLKNLPSWIDPESIQIKLSPSDGFEISGTQAKTVYLQKVTESEVLEVSEKLIALRDRIEDINTMIDALSEEKKYLNGLINWTQDKIEFDKVSKEINITEIEEMKDFLRKAMLNNYNEQNRLYREIRDLTPELSVLEKKWNELAGKSKLEKKDIEIDIISEKSAKTKISVSYLISGASWFTKYDALINDDTKKVKMRCNAIVQQSTGEDWSDANFTLSTIKPYLIKEQPELNPWFVTPTNANTVGEYLNRGFNDNEYNKMRSIQEKQKEFYKGDYELNEAFDNYQTNIIKAEEVLRQAEERGTTVEFSISGEFTVKSDGNPVKMLIGTTDLDTKNQYSAIPVISKSTYMTGNMRNNADFPFLPGEVRILKNGNFIGKTKINFVANQEKMDLYLGLEERIKVSRKLDAKKSSHSFMRNKKTLVVGYNITVQNFLDKSVSISISDQIPVSQDNSVKVKITEIEPKADTTDQGILTWNIELKPMETRTIYFGFTMEYPDDIYLDNAEELEKQLLNLK